MRTQKDPPDWRQFFRVAPIIIFCRNRPLRRRRLAQEAARIPTGLAALSLADDLWSTGDISEAYQLAEKVLQARPDLFELLLICLGYYVRTRDSQKIYVFAERLIAAKSSALQTLRVYKALGLFLWPFELLGIGRRVVSQADYANRWILWAKNYIATHQQWSGNSDQAESEPLLKNIPAIENKETSGRGSAQ